MQTADAKAVNEYHSTNNESNFPMNFRFQLYNSNDTKKNWLYFSNSHPVYRHLFEFKYTFFQTDCHYLPCLKLTNGIDNNNDEKTWAESHFSLAQLLQFDQNCGNTTAACANIVLCTLSHANWKALLLHSKKKAQNRFEFYRILDWKVIAVDFNNLNWADFLNTHPQTLDVNQLLKLSLSHFVLEKWN